MKYSLAVSLLLSSSSMTFGAMSERFAGMQDTLNSKLYTGLSQTKSALLKKRDDDDDDDNKGQGSQYNYYPYGNAQIKSLAQKTSGGVDLDIFWGYPMDQTYKDEFGNTIGPDGDGNFRFRDKYGTTWTVVAASEGSAQTYKGAARDGSTWEYDLQGYTSYFDGINQMWVSHPEGKEDYTLYRGNFTDYTTTNADQSQQTLLYQQEDESYDTYNYYWNGDKTWEQEITLDSWTWTQLTNDWCYHFGDTQTEVCVYGGNVGCIETPSGNEICYNIELDQWLFRDLNAPDFQFYYYPGWSWGTIDQEWYLYDDLHDVWVEASY